MASTELLQKQRRDALRFELICWGLAILGPAVAGILLRDRLPEIFQSAVFTLVPLIPVILLVGAAIGFHRLRKSIDRKLSG